MIDILRTYCTTHDIEFIYGSRQYQNAISSRKKYEADKRIMLADFRVKPIFEGYKVQHLRFVGTMGLGQVRETETRANLSEFPIQKYDLRLKELFKDFLGIVQDISCLNDIEVQDCMVRYDLNKFDLNADFVFANITLEYGYRGLD